MKNMLVVTVADLKDKVISMIHSTINLSRGISRDHPHAMNAAASEFEMFIKSIPYFEDELKLFLLGRSCLPNAFLIDKDWHSMFVGFISSWAHGPQWLGENVFEFDEDLVEKILADTPKLHRPI